MLTNLAIWYLRKKRKSVLIGYEITDGFVKAINNQSFLYDNHLIDVTYRTSDNYPLGIPDGKFNITKK